MFVGVILISGGQMYPDNLTVIINQLKLAVKHGSDSLVDFYEDVVDIAKTNRCHIAFRGKVCGKNIDFNFPNKPESYVIISIDAVTDRLSRQELSVYLSNPEQENIVARSIYDLLDNVWRFLDDQDEARDPALNLEIKVA